MNCPNCGRELYLEQVTACAGCQPVLLRKCRCGYSEPVIEQKKTPAKAKVNLKELKELWLKKKEILKS